MHAHDEGSRCETVAAPPNRMHLNVRSLCLPFSFFFFFVFFSLSLFVQVYTGQLWCQTNNAATAASYIQYDVHAPGQIRVFAPSQNRPEFAEAFNCPADSFMGRSLKKERCTIW